MSFIYVQDEPDKSVSFISNIDYSQQRRSSANSGPNQIKLENYNNVYQQNNLPPQYSDYPKDANGRQPKPEPPLKFSSELLAPSIPVSSQPSPMMQGYIPEINSCMPMLISSTGGPNNSISGINKSDFRKSDGMVSQKNDYCFNDNASISPALSSTEPSFRKYQCLDGSVNLAQSGQSTSEKQQQNSAPAQTQGAFVTPPRTSSTVSEALFVQIIVSRCKRIAPLWFRGISSMRERNREENRRTSTNSGQTQNDWSIIAGKIREMNQIMETDTVVNLLKKLHKELQADSVLKFIKCWLGDPEALNDPDSCVLSRPDAKGRMRRIDGGKGSDKVWRLDTIVGMLYHGLPMSSTDTNIMVHTCSQELCVRPQHIRFRASSVALVIVLKALAQAGYSIIPPALPPSTASNGNQPPDESVDVFGPFTIEELQQYRSENLTPAGESVSRVPLNASDRDLAESLPLIRDILNQTDSSSASSSVSSKLSHPPAAAALPQPPLSATADGMRMLNGGGMGIDMHDQNLDIKPPPSTFQTNSNGPPKLTTSASSRFQPASSVVSGASSTGSTSKRRSLKRPAQPSSNINSNNGSNCVTPAKNIQDGVTVTTTMAQTVPLNLPSSTTSSALPDANVFLGMNSAKQLADHQQFPTHFTTQPATALIGCNHHHGGMQPLYAPQPIGPPTVQPPPPPAPLSGKSTPRQPAKKRLEARTPTIEELGVPSAFKALHDTPFTPVLGRSANSASGSSRDVSAPTSTAAVSSASGGGGEVKTKPEEDEDEEMNAIFAGPVARRHHSTINQPPIGNLVFADYKILHERLQQHVANGGLAGLESPNALFFRTTPYGKRCASACALPSLSPSIGSGGGVGGFADDLRQMPSLLPASPPSHTGAAGDSEGGSTHQIPPPPRLTPGFGAGIGGGRLSKPPLSTTPGPPGLFDRDTPGSLRNLASRFRDSPIFSTNSEILEVLVSLAQEYGVQSNRTGSSCSRPASQHYLRRNLFLGNDSPSPAGLPLNMLSTPVSDSAGGNDLIDSNNTSTSNTNPANQNQQQLLFDHNSPQAPPPPQSDYNQ